MEILIAQAGSLSCGLRIEAASTCDSKPVATIFKLTSPGANVDVAVGYSKSNASPILKLFLSRLDELVASNQKH